jgi:hypothetical protein
MMNLNILVHPFTFRNFLGICEFGDKMDLVRIATNIATLSCSGMTEPPRRPLTPPSNRVSGGGQTHVMAHNLGDYVLDAMLEYLERQLMKIRGLVFMWQRCDTTKNAHQPDHRDTEVL